MELKAGLGLKATFFSIGFGLNLRASRNVSRPHSVSLASTFFKIRSACVEFSRREMGMATVITSKPGQVYLILLMPPGPPPPATPFIHLPHPFTWSLLFCLPTPFPSLPSSSLFPHLIVGVSSCSSSLLETGSDLSVICQL